MRADRALNAIQSQIISDAVVEKEIYDARTKARKALIAQLSGEVDTNIPGMVGEDVGYDGDEQVDDPMGHGRRYLGEAQSPTVPIEDAPNPFPMLDQPLG